MDKAKLATTYSSNKEEQLSMPDARTPRASFIIIHEFMMQDLKLSGVELLLYARIFGFSAAGRDFYESKKNTAKYFGVSSRSVFNACGVLVYRKLIYQTKITAKTESNCYSIRKEALPDYVLNNLNQYGWVAYEECTYAESSYEEKARENPPPYAETPQPLMQIFHPIRKDNNKGTEMKGGP